MIILNEQEMWEAVSLNEVMDAIENAFAIHKAGSYVMPGSLHCTKREKHDALHAVFY